MMNRQQNPLELTELRGNPIIKEAQQTLANTSATLNTTMAYESILSSRLIKCVIEEFALDPRGEHGTSHWMRARENGLRLAHITGANPKVIEAFALFHDSKRYNENTDPDHGKRGADNAEDYWIQGALDITQDEMALVYDACSGHTYETIANPCTTIHTCWDADRLDLGRVGIVPDPNRLCTEAARDPDILEWAFGRSMQWVDRQWR